MVKPAAYCTRAVDIWAIGIIALESLFGILPPTVQEDTQQAWLSLIESKVESLKNKNDPTMLALVITDS